MPSSVGHLLPYPPTYPLTHIMMVPAKCVDASNKQKLLHPTDPSCDQGPVVDKIQFDRVLGYIEKGKTDGAKLVCGGVRSGDKVSLYTESGT